MADSSLLTKTSSNKNKSWSAPYEPEATNLVIQIQDSANAQTKARLMEDLFKLIMPFTLRVAGHCLKSFYAKRDAEDVAQEFMLKNIMDNDPKHWNTMCLYRYDRTHTEDKTPPSFLKFMGVCLSYYCMDFDKKGVKEQDRRGPSLNADDSDSPEAKAGITNKAKVSMEIFQREEELRSFKKAILMIAVCYLRFYNAVNALDKDKTHGKPFQDGERVVNEQKLLAYHIRFINKEFRQSPKARDYSVDTLRNFSYAQVNYKNNDYLQEEVFRTETDFMKVLEERIISRNLTNDVFLPPELNIRTTVNEWLQAPSMKKRIDAEYVKLRVDVRYVGEESIYGIRI